MMRTDQRHTTAAKSPSPFEWCIDSARCICHLRSGPEVADMKFKLRWVNSTGCSGATPLCRNSLECNFCL
jgi:hypothetical protein